MVKKSFKKPSGHIRYVIFLLTLILLVDGLIRLSFSSVVYYLLPEIYTKTDLFFHWRWFIIGVIELFIVWGIFKRQLWALYGIGGLSLIRVYTILAFPPKGLFLPISSNLVTYLFKLIIFLITIYLIIRRKDFQTG